MQSLASFLAFIELQEIREGFFTWASSFLGRLAEAFDRIGRIDESSSPKAFDPIMVKEVYKYVSRVYMGAFMVTINFRLLFERWEVRFSVKDELFDMEAVSKIFKVDIDIVNEVQSHIKNRSGIALLSTLYLAKEDGYNPHCDINFKEGCNLKHYVPEILITSIAAFQHSSLVCIWVLCACKCVLLFRFMVQKNYNPNKGRGSKKPVTKEVAMEELLEVLKSTKLDNFTPRIVDRKDDYVRVEYESPILGFVDDVEFWFPPGKKPLVQYRSASCIGLGFDANKKRVKVICLSQLFSERSMNAIIVWAFGVLSSLFIACNTSAEIIEPFQLAT
ncbi:putative reverse transcriptase domain-containing protein [Tanacetum coccineum]